MAAASAKSYPPQIQRIIDAYREDEFLQSDLEQPLVQDAIKHWLGINRLPVAEAERKFNDDYRVLQTFGKIQNLQHACYQQGVPFPLELVLKDVNCNNKNQSGKTNGENSGAPLDEVVESSSSILNAKVGTGKLVKNNAKGMTSSEGLTSPVTHTTNEEPQIEGVLKKNKSELKIFPSKEPLVRFANPPKEMEVRFAIEKTDGDIFIRLLHHPWLAMDSYNVAIWWGIQFFVIGVFLAFKLA